MLILSKGRDDKTNLHFRLAQTGQCYFGLRRKETKKSFLLIILMDLPFENFTAVTRVFHSLWNSCFRNILFFPFVRKYNH